MSFIDGLVLFSLRPRSLAPWFEWDFLDFFPWMCLVGVDLGFSRWSKKAPRIHLYSHTIPGRGWGLICHPIAYQLLPKSKNDPAFWVLFLVCTQLPHFYLYHFSFFLAILVLRQQRLSQKCTRTRKICPVISLAPGGLLQVSDQICRHNWRTFLCYQAAVRKKKMVHCVCKKRTVLCVQKIRGSGT